MIKSRQAVWDRFLSLNRSKPCHGKWKAKTAGRANHWILNFEMKK